ncbi:MULTISPECIES: ABC transporter substrate-binding protein [unclassified Micromonospora]|uniref:ABC transporter substrate-binding protein n=1 Tax=unclassified Micromonospora TaxID=2617518 RepID=UPI001375F09D|nr:MULTISPECIES: ABC transporter substrate-binding protein [unclassified Micromonospora]QKW12410.1 ABC transporter substrate-binding protein [Verrucosispora sp. NA02020]
MSHLNSPGAALSRRRLLTGLGGALVGSALLTACGSDDADSSSNDGRTTIRLAGIPASALAAFKLALKEGAFEEAGLDIRYEEYAESAAVYTAYRAGQVDGGLGGIPSTANLVATGVDRKVVFALQRTTNGILVRADSGIQSIADLKGRKLGLFGSAIGSSTNQFFALCREKHGFNPTTDCQVQYGAPNLMAELLGQGDVDMALVIDPAGAPELASGKYRSLGDLGVLLEEATGLKAFTAGWDFASEFIEKNREAVQAFVDVNLRYQTRFNNDQSLWDAALRELYNIDDQAVLDVIWNSQRGRLVEQWGDAEKQQAAQLLTFLSENGEPEFLPKVPDGLFA